MYGVEKFRTILYEQEECTDQIFLYDIFYLVAHDQKEEAQIELLNRFNRFPVLETYEEEYARRNTCLETPSKHYIQIAYKKYLDLSQHISYYVEQDGKQKPKICDPKYAYILDYIDTLISKQLEKRRFLTYEEMMKIAIEFASQKGKSKVKVQ